MQTFIPTPLTAMPPNEPQLVNPHLAKQWAAEDFAIAIGLLRECPYHGQPFRAQTNPLTARSLEAGLIDLPEPVIEIFNGNTQELLTAVEQITGDYGDHCAMCAATDHEDFD